MVATKDQIRKIIKKKILALGLEQRQIWDDKISSQLIDLIKDKNFKNILLYAPLLDEVDISSLLKVKQDDFQVYLPKVAMDTSGIQNLTIHKISHFEQDTVVGAFGIREPTSSMVKSNEIKWDCIVMPARAVDLEGVRLGRGKGFYDQFLQSMRKQKNMMIVSTIYHLQFYPSLPNEAHDQLVDFIISEKGFFQLRRNHQ